jgi:KamA family protein
MAAFRPAPAARIVPRRYIAYTRHDIDRIPELQRLPESTRETMKAVAAVFPFRVNNYVVEELIDWDAIPEDPIYQMTFPQPGMLKPEEYERMISLVRSGAPDRALREAAREIQMRHNPHPAGQKQLNIPVEGGKSLPGMQHKYRETVLFFPSQGQTCHSYCTYCFRWPQFVGIDELKFASREGELLRDYIRRHEEVTDILFTGGDPLVMKTRTLRRYVEPLLEIEHLANIRIGTKAPAYWPYRFLTDPDADDLLRLFEEVRRAGKQLALVAHYSHLRELETVEAQAALRRIQSAGAVVRTQAPLIRHVNDDADMWADMWALQVRLGAIPYYMFVERDTGPMDYFRIPLVECHEIFRRAYEQVSGLARTVRGPSMSCTPGKVLVLGTAEVSGEKVFVLTFLQGRDPRWVGRPFFARFDPEAAWMDELKPAFGDSEFFFEAELREMMERHHPRIWQDWPVRPKQGRVLTEVEEI